MRNQWSASRTPNPGLIAAVKKRLGENGEGDHFGRTALLVASGFKPVAEVGCTRTSTGRLGVGPRPPSIIDEIIDELRKDGVTVSLEGINCNGNQEILIGRDPILIDEVRALFLASKGCGDHPQDAEVEFRLGELLGYPHSGTEAFLGLRPRFDYWAEERDYSLELRQDLAAAACVLAGDPEGWAEGLAWVQAAGSLYRSMIG